MHCFTYNCVLIGSYSNEFCDWKREDLSITIRSIMRCDNQPRLVFMHGTQYNLQ